MPGAVADAVVLAGEGRLLKSHRARVAILFADLRGFTAFCEGAAPETASAVLHEFHGTMEVLLRDHGAGVEQRTGDGVMAVFNDPLPCDRPASAAVQMALAMRARMADLCAVWRRSGHKLGFGVGIALGPATVGLVGSDRRADYTAFGTTVNVAARLCDEARDGEILIGPSALAEVAGEVLTAFRGDLPLKGLADPVPVHNVLGPRAG